VVGWLPGRRRAAHKPRRGVWSVNVERRHLTLEQILAIEVALNGWEKTEAAKAKQAEAGRESAAKRTAAKRGQSLPTSRSEALSSPTDAPKAAHAPDVRKQIATTTGASERKVQQALNVQKAAPDLLQQVAHGKVPLCAAAKKH